MSSNLDLSRFMPLGDDPEVIEAFEIIAGRRKAPLDKHNASDLSRYWSILTAAMDRAERHSLSQGPSTIRQHQKMPTADH